MLWLYMVLDSKGFALGRSVPALPINVVLVVIVMFVLDISPLEKLCLVDYLLLPKYVCDILTTGRSRGRIGVVHTHTISQKIIVK